MAISKEILTASTESEMANKLYTWLNANKEGYFDSVNLADGTITCTVGTGDNAVDILKFTERTDSLYCSFTLKSGSEQVNNAWYIKSAQNIVCKTDNGIAILSGYAGYIGGIFISKNTAEHLCIALTRLDSYDSSPMDFWFGDFADDTVFTEIQTSPCFKGMTTLCNIVFGVDNYAEHMFITPFTDYSSGGVISDSDGKQYVTDGFIALEG